MSIQPEALRLADALDAEFVQGRISNSTGRESAVELRRLHEVNQDLLEALQDVCARLLYRGVSTNAGHPDRTALEVARAAIAKATGGEV